MIHNATPWLMKKVQHVVWDVLIDYKGIKWQNTSKDLIKTPNVAYQDVLG